MAGLPESGVVDWRAEMRPEDRYRICQHIMSKLTVLFHMLPEVKLREKTTKFEAQVFARAESRQDYLTRIAEGLTNVENQVSRNPAARSQGTQSQGGTTDPPPPPPSTSSAPNSHPQAAARLDVQRQQMLLDQQRIQEQQQQLQTKPQAEQQNLPRQQQMPRQDIQAQQPLQGQQQRVFHQQQANQPYAQTLQQRMVHAQQKDSLEDPQQQSQQQLQHALAQPPQAKQQQQIPASRGQVVAQSLGTQQSPMLSQAQQSQLQQTQSQQQQAQMSQLQQAQQGVAPAPPTKPSAKAHSTKEAKVKSSSRKGTSSSAPLPRGTSSAGTQQRQPGQTSSMDHQNGLSAGNAPSASSSRYVPEQDSLPPPQQVSSSIAGNSGQVSAQPARTNPSQTASLTPAQTEQILSALQALSASHNGLTMEQSAQLSNLSREQLQNLIALAQQTRSDPSVANTRGTIGSRGLQQSVQQQQLGRIGTAAQVQSHHQLQNQQPIRDRGGLPSQQPSNQQTMQPPNTQVPPQQTLSRAAVNPVRHQNARLSTQHPTPGQSVLPETSLSQSHQSGQMSNQSHLGTHPMQINQKSRIPQQDQVRSTQHAILAQGHQGASQPSFPSGPQQTHPQLVTSDTRSVHSGASGQFPSQSVHPSGSASSKTAQPRPQPQQAQQNQQQQGPGAPPQRANLERLAQAAGMTIDQLTSFCTMQRANLEKMGVPQRQQQSRLLEHLSLIIQRRQNSSTNAATVPPGTGVPTGVPTQATAPRSDSTRAPVPDQGARAGSAAAAAVPTTVGPIAAASNVSMTTEEQLWQRLEPLQRRYKSDFEKLIPLIKKAYKEQAPERQERLMKNIRECYGVLNLRRGPPLPPSFTLDLVAQVESYVSKLVNLYAGNLQTNGNTSAAVEKAQNGLIPSNQSGSANAPRSAIGSQAIQPTQQDSMTGRQMRQMQNPQGQQIVAAPAPIPSGQTESQPLASINKPHRAPSSAALSHSSQQEITRTGANNTGAAPNRANSIGTSASQQKESHATPAVGSVVGFTQQEQLTHNDPANIVGTGFVLPVTASATVKGRPAANSKPPGSGPMASSARTGTDLTNALKQAGPHEQSAQLDQLREVNQSRQEAPLKTTELANAVKSEPVKSSGTSHQQGNLSDGLTAALLSAQVSGNANEVNMIKQQMAKVAQLQQGANLSEGNARSATRQALTQNPASVPTAVTHRRTEPSLQETYMSTQQAVKTALDLSQRLEARMETELKRARLERIQNTLTALRNNHSLTPAENVDVPAGSDSKEKRAFSLVDVDNFPGVDNLIKSKTVFECSAEVGVRLAKRPKNEGVDLTALRDAVEMDCRAAKARNNVISYEIFTEYGLPVVVCQLMIPEIKLPKLYLRVQRGYPRKGGATYQFERPQLGWIGVVLAAKLRFKNAMLIAPAATVGVAAYLDAWAQEATAVVTEMKEEEMPSGDADGAMFVDDSVLPSVGRLEDPLRC